MLMATRTKKSSTKSKATKRITRHITRTDSHFMVERSIGVYAVVVFLVFWVVAVTAFVIDRMGVEQLQKIHDSEISSIYTDLNLGDSYNAYKTSSYGLESSIATTITEYGRNSSVDDTINDATAKIKNAGFSQVSTDNPDGTSQTYNFKNAKGNYIALKVVPGSIHENDLYNTPYPTLSSADAKKMSPSYVRITVSLKKSSY